MILYIANLTSYMKAAETLLLTDKDSKDLIAMSFY